MAEIENQNITYTNPDEVYEEKLAGQDLVIDYAKAKQPIPLIGDVETYLMHRSARGKSDKLIARFRFNTAFIHRQVKKEEV